ncbi:MAG: chromosome segregation protein SMC, partial [Armatimonadota bacterium]
TRRVYRNGEGEYFINKTACRLKDITELFLDTGVGRGAYAIVNQSEIDSILSARPEDRRELFEEAAGIKKYRVRKREAQRKLENTESNLVRVRDILAEIEGQVDPLRLQAETALKHRDLETRLRSIEVGMLASDYRRLRDEVAELHRVSETAATEEAALLAESGTLESGAQDLGERIAGAETRMEEARLRQQIALSRAERIETRVALAEERRAGAQRTLETIETEIVEAQTLGRDRESEAEMRAAEAGAMEAALEDARVRGAAAEALVREIEQSLEELSKSLAGSEADTVSAARSLAQRRVELATLRERIARRSRDLEELSTRLERRTTDVEAARSDCEALQRAVAEAVAGHAAARTAVSEHAEPALRAAEAHLRTAVDDRAAAERRLAGAESRLRALEETEAAKEGVFAGVRAILAAAAEGAVAGRFRLFADAIRVPAEIETAIEVALGASLQDIVTDSERSAKAAIAWLNDQRAGRATFLPIDALRDQPVPASLRSANRRFSGVLGSAADLVSFDAEDEPAVRVHLARVLVVDDLETATRAAKEIDRDWARIVTLGGELVVPTGAITGGRTGRTGPNLLGRKREISELRKAVASGRTAVVEGGDRIDRLRDEEARLRLALREAESGVLSARDLERDTERKRQARQLERDRLEKDVQVVSDRREHLVGEAEIDARAEQALAEAIAAADRDDEGAQATREDWLRRQEELRIRRDEARETWSAVRTEAASLRERHAAFLREVGGARADAGRAQARAAELRRRAEEATRVLDVEAGVLIECDRERESAASAVRDATHEVETLRERRQALVAENFQLSERVKLLRRAVDTAREQGQQAKVRAARVETQAESVAQRLLEEYELHPDSALALTGGEPVERDIALEIGRLRREIKSLGPVNPAAIEEFERVSERHQFLSGQRSDLDEARARLLEAIQEIDESTRGVFLETYSKVGESFGHHFTRLFGGGTTELVLTQPDDLLETGIDIIAQPPGKRRQNLALLSGGERALTATALLFAFLDVRP